MLNWFAGSFALLFIAGVNAPSESGVVHPEATLKSPVTSIEAGAALPLSGEEFIAGDPVTLVLRGVLDEIELRAVTPEEGGVFSIELPVPSEVSPGTYRVVAVASDGDVIASLDLTVLAAQVVLADEHAAIGEESAEHDEVGPVARADERPIERSRGGMEWGLIGLLVGLAGGGGMAMLRG